MLVVDANVWLAASNPAEPAHHDAVAFMLAAANESFACPTLLLIEVAGAAARRSRDTNEGAQLAAKVASDPRIVWEPITHSLMSIGTRLASTHFLRGADACYAAVAELHNVPLITLDVELEKRTNDRIYSMSPGAWVAHYQLINPQ